MKKIILDLNEEMPKEAVHSYLKEKLGFPEYYGENLDALYDCLTDISEPTAIGLFVNGSFIDETDAVCGSEDAENDGANMQRSDEYIEKLIKVFADAERSNDNLAVIFGR